MSPTDGSVSVADAVVLRSKDGLTVDVREYRPTDRENLERFYDEFEPKRTAQGLPPSGIDRVRRWLDSILEAGLHLVALNEGELIGHAFVVPTGRDGIGEYAVFLRHDVRGRGIGTELNRTVLDWGKRAGWKGFWLTVEPHNRAAIRSYEKVGFHFVPGTMYGLEAEMERAL